MAFALCLLTINAQKMETFHNVIGYWNKSTEKWNYDNGHDARITFELQGDYLIADDEANSRYFLYEVKDSEDENFFEVDAVDERGVYCTIMISNNNNGVDKIAIIYSSRLYEYWFFF